MPLLTQTYSILLTHQHGPVHYRCPAASGLSCSTVLYVSEDRNKSTTYNHTPPSIHANASYFPARQNANLLGYKGPPCCRRNKKTALSNLHVHSYHHPRRPRTPSMLNVRHQIPSKSADLDQHPSHEQQAHAIPPGKMLGRNDYTRDAIPQG
jgi:hypothetical protein